MNIHYFCNTAQSNVNRTPPPPPPPPLSPSPTQPSIKKNTVVSHKQIAIYECRASPLLLVPCSSCVHKDTLISQSPHSCYSLGRFDIRTGRLQISTGQHCTHLQQSNRRLIKHNVKYEFYTVSSDLCRNYYPLP